MIGLDALIEEYGDAIAYDLISLGLRLRDLGSEEFTWGDLGVVLRQAPRSSAFIRAYDPEAHEWGLSEQLMALVADYTAVGNWQRGSGKTKDYPKPIPRPGVDTGENKFGKGAVAIDDINEWLGWD